MWFTCRREYCKCKTGFCSGDNSENETQKRNSKTDYWEYWDYKVNREEAFSTYLSAISSLVEDAPEIILLVYIIGSGIQHETLGEV